MSTDWDRMISEHYEAGNKKELSLDFLMESVREALSEISDKPAPKPLTEEDAERFSITIPIPKWTPSEAWGDPDSQSRKDIERIFSSITRQPDIKARIDHVNSFLDPAQAERKAPGGKINTVLNMLQIIEALQATLNDYNDASAGFVFEGFMAALTGGRQEAGRVGGTLPIEDFITGDNENVSLKLLSPKTPIHGSFTNLIDYLFIRGGSGVPAIKYMVAYKKVEGGNVSKLSIFEFVLNRGNLIDAFVQSGGTGNLGLLGDQAGVLKQHIANWQDSKEWRLQMAEILRVTPGYTEGRGMFYVNLEGGEFVDRSKDSTDKGTSDFAAAERGGAKIVLYNRAQKAGLEAQRGEGDFEGWFETLEDDTLIGAGFKGLASKNANTRKSNIERAKTVLQRYFDEGFEHAKATMNESYSYFGSFHEREKKLMKEELLLEAKGSTGGSQWTFTRTHIENLTSLMETRYFGILDLSQANIGALSKIYTEKIGKDLMALLENTKNFSENIGRYFSADDRSEASSANKTARDQGKEIVSSLEEREKEEEI